MGSPLGPVTTRFRCSGCGNLTRFDVVAMRRTSAFHHYTVGGDLTIVGLGFGTVPVNLATVPFDSAHKFMATAHDDQVADHALEDLRETEIHLALFHVDADDLHHHLVPEPVRLLRVLAAQRVLVASDTLFPGRRGSLDGRE